MLELFLPIIFMLFLQAYKDPCLPLGLLGQFSGDYNMPTTADAAANLPHDSFGIVDFLLLVSCAFFWILLLRALACWFLLPAARAHLQDTHRQQRQEAHELHERLLAHRRNAIAAIAAIAAEENWWDRPNFEAAIAAQELPARRRLPARQRLARDRPMFLFDSGDELEEVLELADNFNDDR